MNAKPEPIVGQFSLRALFVLTAIVAMVLGLLVAAGKVLREIRPKVEIGPVASAELWPRPLQELVAAASAGGLNARPDEVFRKKDWMETYDYWSVAASAELLELMVASWQLRPARASDAGQYLRQWPTERTAVPDNGTLKYYGNFRHKGPNFVVIVDAEHELLHVYYYDNF